jgi:aminopeptidase C
VLHDHCSELDDRNHAVVLTGYGIDDDGVPFWRGVNTFGPEWGEGGYFRIERNATKCGIDQEVLMIGM